MASKDWFIVQKKRRDTVIRLDLCSHSNETPGDTGSYGEDGTALQRLVGHLHSPRMRNPIVGLRSIVGYSNGKAKKRMRTGRHPQIDTNEREWDFNRSRWTAQAALYFIFPLLGPNCRMSDFAVQ
jgi:hypothetical protein